MTENWVGQVVISLGCTSKKILTEFSIEYYCLRVTTIATISVNIADFYVICGHKLC